MSNRRHVDVLAKALWDAEWSYEWADAPQAQRADYLVMSAHLLNSPDLQRLFLDSTSRATEIRARAWDEGARAGMVAGGWSSRVLASNPYRREIADRQGDQEGF